MRNILLLHLVMLLPVFGGYSQGVALGIGPTYGSDIKYIGPNMRVYYFFNEHICLGPEVSYFAKHNLEGYPTSLLELNISAHYNFELGDHFAMYPLTGLNFSIENKDLMGEVESENAFGLNLGAGFHYSIKKVLPFAEYKYIFGKLPQHLITVGILFMLSDKSDKHKVLHE